MAEPKPYFSSKRMSEILEALEKIGHIVIMDRETEDYAITTTDPFTAMRILDYHKLECSVYNKKYNNYTIDFTLSIN
jgi:hypothetical protein